MNKPTLEATLAAILQQRATLAKYRAEADFLDDYLTAIQARASGTWAPTRRDDATPQSEGRVAAGEEKISFD